MFGPDRHVRLCYGRKARIDLELLRSNLRVLPRMPKWQELLRAIEDLLAAPWNIALSAANGFPFANETGVQIANPVSFLAQKILIHRRRNRDERAKDILYMHDTIDTFATRIDDLSAEWVRNIRHELHANIVRAVESASATLFGAVTDSIRVASQIVQARNLTPEAIRETCNLGFSRIFRTRGQ